MGVCAVCGMNGFSTSAEHGNVELCFKHYNTWLKSGEAGKRTKVEDLK